MLSANPALIAFREDGIALSPLRLDDPWHLGSSAAPFKYEKRICPGAASGGLWRPSRTPNSAPLQSGRSDAGRLQGPTGHSLQKRDVCATPAFPPIATTLRTR